MGREDVLRALQGARTGEIFDLESERWHGMPVWIGHPPFSVLTYRTPAGIKLEGDQGWLEPNDEGYAWHSEVLSHTVHSGTHIDALGHVSCGWGDRMHGGCSAAEAIGDHGLRAQDAAALEPIVARGVLIEAAAQQGVEALPAGAPISAADLEVALSRQEVGIGAGDVVLVRTGYQSAWPDSDRAAAHFGAGIDLGAAELLAAAGVAAVGGDTESLECQPSGIEGRPQPVHVTLLIEAGVPILELLNLEQLAAARCYEFTFVCAPLKIRGATGSMVRPLAIA
jgi:kynurenine formamidase